jgi:hypothetical protein
VHVGKRRAVVAHRVGEGATTVGRTHRIVDEHPIGREQVDPALQIFPFGNRIGVTNSGHIVIMHELLLSAVRIQSRIVAERGVGRPVAAPSLLSRAGSAYPEVFEAVRDASKTAAKVASGREFSFDRLPRAVRSGQGGGSIG